MSSTGQRLLSFLTADRIVVAVESIELAISVNFEWFSFQKSVA